MLLRHIRLGGVHAHTGYLIMAAVSTAQATCSLSAWLRCQKMLLMLLERSSVSSCCAGAAECATGEARMVP